MSILSLKYRNFVVRPPLFIYKILRVSMISKCCGFARNNWEWKEPHRSLKTALMEVTEWFHHLTSGQPSKLEQKGTQRQHVMADAQTESFSATAELSAFPLLWAAESVTKAHGAYMLVRPSPQTWSHMLSLGHKVPPSSSFFTDRVTHPHAGGLCFSFLP